MIGELSPGKVNVIPGVDLEFQRILSSNRSLSEVKNRMNSAIRYVEAKAMYLK